MRPPPGLVLLAGLLSSVTGAITAPGAAATAPHRPSGAVIRAVALARLGVLRRSDLGAGWSGAGAAPSRAPTLTCGPTATGSAASAVWSGVDGTVFASGTAYAYANAALVRAAWARTASPAMGRCLERQFADGSGHGVALRATGVRRVAPPAVGSGTAVRRYEVIGTATGAGQQTDVTIDIALVRDGSWIGEDELSAAASSPPGGVQRRIVAAQTRRLHS